VIHFRYFHFPALNFSNPFSSLSNLLINSLWDYFKYCIFGFWGFHILCLYLSYLFLSLRTLICKNSSFF
jgi:hypothetical protein